MHREDREVPGDVVDASRESYADNGHEMAREAIQDLAYRLQDLGVSSFVIAYELTEQAKRLKNYS